jgi:hypothetical protein
MNIKPKGGDAKITREERRADDADVQRSNHNLRESGAGITPIGFEFIGSACVHFYRAPNLGNEHSYKFGVIADLDAIQEGNADTGLKELRRRMMQRYGRTEN